MKTLNTKLAATTAILMALGGSAFAQTLNVDSERLNLALDTDGNGEVTDDEIIEGNMALFDTNNDGVIDAAERGEADRLVMQGGTIDPMVVSNPGSEGLSIDFNTNTARLDLGLDTDGNGEVTDDEIIDGNMALFDTNGDGAIDAAERGEAEEVLMSGNSASLDAVDANVGGDMVSEFDADRARLDLTLDTDGNGEVTDDEIIEGNMALFDLDGDGTIDASERGMAEDTLRTN